MNAGERIQAAIDKLEALSSWVDAPLTVHEGPEWYELHDESGVQVAPYMGGGAAELFITLHRTIDAQLAILRTVIEISEFVGLGVDGERVTIIQNAFDLADAILGGES